MEESLQKNVPLDTNKSMALKNINIIPLPNYYYYYYYNNNIIIIFPYRKRKKKREENVSF